MPRCPAGRDLNTKYKSWVLVTDHNLLRKLVCLKFPITVKLWRILDNIYRPKTSLYHSYTFPSSSDIHAFMMIGERCRRLSRRLNDLSIWFCAMCIFWCKRWFIFNRAILVQSETFNTFMLKLQVYIFEAILKIELNVKVVLQFRSIVLPLS